MNLPRLSRCARIALLALPLAVGPAHAADHLISIDFPGGPLSKLVAELNKEDKVSIIESIGLDPELPAFSVKDARVEWVLGALGQLLEPQGYLLHTTGPNVAVLVKLQTHTSQDFAAFRLENKLGSRSVDDIVSAIQTACAFAHPDGKASTLRFKYHPGTKLLFVAGTEQEVGIANRVFERLAPDSESKEPPPEKK